MYLFFFSTVSLLLVLTVLPPTTIRPLLCCLPVWRAGAPAEDDILTVSCYTANKRTFLNDELLLWKWFLTDTVSAWQSHSLVNGGVSDSDHFHDCGGPQRGAKRLEVTLDE